MSYILDALRKAEAERQRGAVPGLHDQAGAAGMPVAIETRQGRGLRWPLIVGLLLVAALVGVLWVYRGLWPAPPVPVQERERQAALAQPPAGVQTAQSPAPAAGVTVAQAPVPPANTAVVEPSQASKAAPLPVPPPTPAPARTSAPADGHARSPFPRWA